MKPLDPRSQQYIIDLLTPLMTTEQDRRSLLIRACTGSPVVQQIDFTGPTLTFLPMLVHRLYQYGKLDDGRPALWALLETAREQVGLDQKQRIDALRPTFELPPSPRLDRIFTSYSRESERQAQRIVSDLKDAGLRVWFDRENIKGGKEWWEAVVRGITAADYFLFCISIESLRSKSAHNELLMARQQGKPIFAIMLEDCWAEFEKQDLAEISGLPKLHIIDFTQPEKYGAALRELIQSLPGYTPPDSYFIEQYDPRELPNPFRGLEAFLEVDAAYFFGREDVVQDLLAHLQDSAMPRLLAVVGASGSGKSSLVRAGLIPGIHQTLPFWETLTIRPGASPLNELADRLQDRLGTGNTPTRERLRQQQSALDDIAVELLSGKPQDARFVVVIDQFEELFTLTGENERQRFLELVLYAVNCSSGRVQFVLTMRADFFDRLSAIPDLAKLVRQNLDIATDMTLDQIRRSIEEPAHKVGVSYEDGLVEQILADVREQPGALPLLQFALKELFERKVGRVMIRDAYEMIGGVKGALATRAEAVYSTFSNNEQSAVRRVMLRLVDVSDEGVTKRPVSQTDLLFSDIPQPTIQSILDKLTDAQVRILVASVPLQLDATSSTPHQTFYEISHEALLTHWKRLEAWIGENRDDLRQGGEILRLARVWDASRRADPSYLLTGGRLVAALEWIERADESRLEREFIEASRAEQQRVTRQRQRVRNLIAAAAAVAIVVLAILSIVAVDRASEASNQSNARATSQKMAEQKAKEAEQNAADNMQLKYGIAAFAELGYGKVENGVMLALEAAKKEPYSAAVERALAYAVSNSFPRQLLLGHSETIPAASGSTPTTTPTTDNVVNTVDVAWSPDGARLLSLDELGLLIMWDMATSKPLKHIETGITNTPGYGSQIEWSADGRYISITGNNQLLIMDGSSGARVFHDRQVVTANCTSWSPDNRFLLTANPNGTLSVYDVISPYPIVIIDVNRFADHYLAGNGVCARWTAQRDTFVVAAGNELMVMNRSGDILAHIIDTGNPNGSVPDIEPISGTSRVAVTNNLSSSVRIFDLTLSDSYPVVTFDTSAGIMDMDITRDGLFLAAIQLDGTLDVWDLPEQTKVAAIRTNSDLVTNLTHRFIQSIQWSPDGLHLATTFRSTDIGQTSTTQVSSGAAIWEIWSVRQTIWAHHGMALSVEFSPKSDQLLTAGTGVRKATNLGNSTDTVAVWNVANGRPQRIVNDHVLSTFDASWSPNGQFIATIGGKDGLVRIWDVRNQSMVQDLNVGLTSTNNYSGTNYGRVAWSPDSTRLALSSNALSGTSKDIAIYNLDKKEIIARLDGSSEGIISAGWSPDGTTIASATRSGIVKLWDGISYHSKAEFNLSTDLSGFIPGRVMDLDWSPNGRWLLATTLGGAVVLSADSTLGSQWYRFSTQIAAAGAAWSPNGNRIAFATLAGAISILQFDPSLRDVPYPVYQTLVRSEAIVDIDWSRDGQYIAVASRNLADRIDDQGDIETDTVHIYRVWQGFDDLKVYAAQCCIVRSFTYLERNEYMLPTLTFALTATPLPTAYPTSTSGPLPTALHSLVQATPTPLAIPPFTSDNREQNLSLFAQILSTSLSTNSVQRSAWNTRRTIEIIPPVGPLVQTTEFQNQHAQTTYLIKGDEPNITASVSYGDILNWAGRIQNSRATADIRYIGRTLYVRFLPNTYSPNPNANPPSGWQTVKDVASYPFSGGLGLRGYVEQDRWTQLLIHDPASRNRYISNISLVPSTPNGAVVSTLWVQYNLQAILDTDPMLLHFPDSAGLREQYRNGQSTYVAEFGLNANDQIVTWKEHFSLNFANADYRLFTGDTSAPIGTIASVHIDGDSETQYSRINDPSLVPAEIPEVGSAR